MSLARLWDSTGLQEIEPFGLCSSSSTNERQGLTT
nr:MAG TPA: hypothetical protein [Caudoviricetes sp.]